MPPAPTPARPDTDLAGRPEDDRRGALAVLGAAAFAAWAVGWPAIGRAVEPLTQHDVVLLQPGTVLERRVDDAALAAWLQRVGAAATASLKAHPQQVPTAGFLALAVRPGGRLKAWTDFKPALAADTETALLQAVDAVPPVSVTGGVVVVGLRVSVWGARPPERHAPAPDAWREAARRAGHPLPLDELIDVVWPE